MEMTINFKSMRLSWVFVVVSLIIWLVVDFVKSGDLPLTLFAIIAIQNAVFFGYKLYLTRRMDNDTNEE